ncbi:MAG: amino acid permease [Clostridia bacterium]|nr:amino acid permease [Clostridia bacterium]
MGEILLASGSVILAGLICFNRKRAGTVQSVMAILLLAGIFICFLAALIHRGGDLSMFRPAFSPQYEGTSAAFIIFALAPWAYVGFESISHSAHEVRYPLKKTFGILALALLAGAAAYAMLALLAATALPEDCRNWVDYILNLDRYTGLASQPTFFAAHEALGTAGTAILGISAFCGIFTGLIGNFIALSRLLSTLADDKMMPKWFGKRNDRFVPTNAILFIMGVSVFLPFFGRTAISWIVDVTTVGATIAYAFASAAACRVARREGNRFYLVVGLTGVVVSLLFALEFLIPNLTDIKTLSTESYLILAAWGILGFISFRILLSRDRDRRMGRSIVAWVVLLGLIIFTSGVWVLQTTQNAIERSALRIQSYYLERLGEAGVNMTSSATRPVSAYLRDELDQVGHSLGRNSLMQMALVVVAIVILLRIYSQIQKRERQTEVEKALAEESSRAKTSFLSNMSHEIRTPMNAIIGLDNIALRDPDLTPRTREHLEKIGASAKHLLGLINDILDMSRIESGRVVLKNEEFSFREFLDQINIMINGQCQDKGLTYECHIIGKVSDYYRGDDMKLKQVLINILGNSVKFTNPPGSVTLSVEQTGSYEGINVLRFVMSDTGIGMDREFIPKIFEAFSQEDVTNTNSYGGSGLGMAITRNFVEMMNGEISVESEKGVGTTFTVTVSLKSSSRSASEEHGQLPPDLRVLVVDDDEIACEHSEVVLRSIGIEADTTEKPAEALQMVRKAHEQGNPYHLLLTDYKMPDMNGLELVHAIRAFDHGETAVIMLTGYNWDDIEEEAEREKVDRILAKPLFTDSLLRTIHAVLDKRRGVTVGAQPIPEAPEAGALAGCRVLMAEDVEQNAEILADLLELEEIESEHAENGEIAVRMFSEHPAGYYDAILMDVRMPVMDGLTATRQIRAMAREDAKTIPIIAMTANVFDEDVERSLQAGMNVHLSKPIEPERLYETMAKLIRKRPVPAGD